MQSLKRFTNVICLFLQIVTSMRSITCTVYTAFPANGDPAWPKLKFIFFKFEDV